MSKTDLSYYTKFVTNTINDLKCLEGSIFIYEEQLSFAKTYMELSAYINNHDSSSFSDSLINEYVFKIQKFEFKILLIEEFDDGSYSQFFTKHTIGIQSIH